MEIRRAESGDCAQMAAVLREAFASFQPLYTPEAFAATTPAEAQIRARLDEGPGWVAVVDDVVGTVSAVPRPGGLYVRSMAVTPGAQGQGAGWALLVAVEAFAREVGSPRLFLSTTPFLLSAIRLYERFGFARIPVRGPSADEGPHELFGTPLFTMAKRLV